MTIQQMREDAACGVREQQRGRLSLGEGVEFGGNGPGFCCSELPEDVPYILQARLPVVGLAGGQSAAAQAGLGLGLVPQAADLACQIQGSLVALPGVAEITAGLVQRSRLV